jgi:hypothetical protein
MLGVRISTLRILNSRMLYFNTKSAMSMLPAANREVSLIFLTNRTNSTNKTN